MAKKKRKPVIDKGTVHRAQKYKPELLPKIGILAYEGLNNQEIAKGIGVSYLTLWKWKDYAPLAWYAIRIGRKRYKKKLERKSNNTELNDFIYGKLPPELKEYWDYIMDAYSKDPGITIAQLDTKLGDTAVEAKMALFFHAWYKYNFNVSEARRRINVPAREWEKWLKDPVFTAIFEQMDVIKGDFFESHVVKLVKRGHAGITQAANEAFNKKKYGRKLGVEYSGGIEHHHSHTFDISTLNLPVKVQRVVLDAIRHQRALEAGETVPVPAKEIVDI